MEWIFLKIFSDMLAASNTVTVKEMLSYHVPDQRLYLFSVALVSLPFAGIGVLYLFTLSSEFHVILALLVGIMYISAGYFYYQAMSVDEATRLSLLFRTGAVFTLLLSIVILREHLTLVQYLGCGLSFAGGLLLVIERSGVVHFGPGTRAALLCNLCGALSFTIKAYLLKTYSSWDTFAITRIGVILGTLLILGVRNTWTSGQALFHLRLKNCSILLTEQVIRLVSLFLSTIAFAQIGSATKMSVLSGFHPLYVWIIAVIAGHETIRSAETWKRISALVLLLGSSYLMHL